MEREHPRRMISDRVWEQLKAALAEAKHSRAGAPAELSDRDFLEAVWYLNRVGCPWRDLPSELGYWHAVSMRFRRWEERGVWRRLWQCLQCECFAQARPLLMDSTTVRAHQHAAGAPKKTAATRLWGALAALLLIGGSAFAGSFRGSGRDVTIQAESSSEARRTVMKMFPAAVVTGVSRRK